MRTKVYIIPRSSVTFFIKCHCERFIKALPAALSFTLACSISAQQTASASSIADELARAAEQRTSHNITYDGRYYQIGYPNGDVSTHIGVCTDVVIRSYRALGIDLQQQVHEDMKANFVQYPSKRLWGLNKPDHNIDHRRVPNLQYFFTRHGQSLPVSTRALDYQPGDIVTWRLPSNVPHIGIVANKRNKETGTPHIVHNIGKGPVIEDRLFAYKITGHYRYLPFGQNQISTMSQ